MKKVESPMMQSQRILDEIVEKYPNATIDDLPYEVQVSARIHISNLRIQTDLWLRKFLNQSVNV